MKSSRTQRGCKIALAAFKAAWAGAINDYMVHKINSERCLQADLYYRLRSRLPATYTIYIETTVLLPPSKTRISVDTLICHKNAIVLAAELKYAPRGAPERPNVKKDLKNLSFLSNRRASSERVQIVLGRYRDGNDDTDKLKLRIASEHRLVFAAYCKKESTTFTKVNFWQRYMPEEGAWAGKTLSPRNLVVLLAKTNAKGHATPAIIERRQRKAAPGA